MTARIRRGPRRREPNHLSDRMAAVRRNGASDLGTIADDLLGQNRIRKVVALAVFLGGGAEKLTRGHDQGAPSQSLHNISYQTLASYRFIKPAGRPCDLMGHLEIIPRNRRLA